MFRQEVKSLYVVSGQVLSSLFSTVLSHHLTFKHCPYREVVLFRVSIDNSESIFEQPAKLLLFCLIHKSYTRTAYTK